VIAQSSRFGGSTIGDFLAELKEKSDLKPKTLEAYAAALRKIVADVIGQGHGREAELKGERCGDKPLKASNVRRDGGGGGAAAAGTGRRERAAKRVVADQAVQIRSSKR
jgi:hypothetical protein